MAYILRSIAVIGAIAFHSPTHERPVAARNEVAPSAIDAALGAIESAREAAAVLAALDPQTRETVLAMLAATLARPSQPERNTSR